MNILAITAINIHTKIIYCFDFNKNLVCMITRKACYTVSLEEKKISIDATSAPSFQGISPRIHAPFFS